MVKAIQVDGYWYNEETGEEMDYPFLTEDGKVVVDPVPLTVEVQMWDPSRDGLSHVPSFMPEDYSDDDDDFEEFEDADAMPITEYEANAYPLPREKKKLSSATTPADGSDVAPDATIKQAGDTSPPVPADL